MSASLFIELISRRRWNGYISRRDVSRAEPSRAELHRVPAGRGVGATRYAPFGCPGWAAHAPTQGSSITHKAHFKTSHSNLPPSLSFPAIGVACPGKVADRRIWFALAASRTGGSHTPMRPLGDEACFTDVPWPRATSSASPPAKKKFAAKRSRGAQLFFGRQFSSYCAIINSPARSF